MAPELMRAESKTATGTMALVDVFSFGVTMYAVMARNRPYCNIDSSASVWTLRDSIVNDCARPLLSTKTLSSAPFAAMKLMEECWDDDPAARPGTFREICRILNECVECERERENEPVGDAGGANKAADASADLHPTMTNPLYKNKPLRKKRSSSSLDMNGLVERRSCSGQQGQAQWQEAEATL